MGRIRGLLCRGDSYYARVVIPPSLRPATGKTELRERLGTDRRAAERDVHAAMARFHDQLSQATRSLAPKALPRPTALSPNDMARAHYAEELERDDFDRMLTAMHGPTPALPGAKEIYKESLRQVASRRTSSDQMAAVIGWAIDRFAQQRSETLVRGSPDWRELGYLLAAVHLEPVRN